MRKALLVVLGIGLLFAPTASQEISVTVPTLKKAAKKPKPLSEMMDPKLMSAAVKLSEAQLMEALYPRLERPVAGVTGFLRLDAKTPWVSGKGSLSIFDADTNISNGATVIFERGGGITVGFLARARPTTYVVDFEFIMTALNVEFTATVGDRVATTTIGFGLQHLVYTFEARGGSQVLDLRIGGPAVFKGVEISILY